MNKFSYLRIVLNEAINCFNRCMTQHWYQMKKLKHITGFLTAREKDSLKKIAKAHNLTLSSYVTRMLKAHIQEQIKSPPPTGPNPR